ncbi:MAG TPA: hypothetical protein PLU50_04840, partial [Pseudobdellovibrionaceae bacterium]|nr:hypothetical protein [Pseudobdellovibrionaceae bacterium]
MLPNILESISIEDRIVIATNSGALITGFEVSFFDMEIDDVSRIEQRLTSYLRDIPTQIRFRIIYNMQLQYELGEELHAQSRYEALSSLGFVQAKAFVFFEKSPSVLQEFVRSFKSIFQAKYYFKNEALKFNQELPIEGLKSIDPTIEPLDLSQYEEFFPERRVETVREFSSLRVGTR